MKKRIAAMLMGIMVVGLVGGCGQTPAAKSVVSTASEDVISAAVDKGVAKVKDSEAVDEAEAEKNEVTEEEQTTVEESTVGETAPDSEEEGFEDIEIGADGSVNGQEFPTIEQVVLDADKSADYGVNSISCFDLDQYLDDAGYISTDVSGEDSFYYEYSGRWAYPVVTPCELFPELLLSSKTDASCDYMTPIVEGEKGLMFSIYSGLDLYDSMVLNVGVDNYNAGEEWIPANLFTVETSDGTSDVIHEYYEISLLDTDSEPVGIHTYYFHVGNFTVAVSPDSDTEYDKDQIQMIADNIWLTNGMER